MCRRVICFLCVCVLGFSLTFGMSTQSFAESAEAGSVRRAHKLVGKPSPLASAMVLVLAGMGVTMLFDKHNRDD